MPQHASISPPDSAIKMQNDQERTKSVAGQEKAQPLSPKEIADLVEAYADRLVRYAFRRLGNLQDAEDVVQEVFVRTFSDRSRRTTISEIGPYLYRSVANASTDLMRKRSYGAVFREEVDAERLFVPNPRSS